MIQTNDCRQSIVIKNQFVSGFFNFDIDIMNMINTQIFDLVPKTFNDSHFEVFAYHLSLNVLHWFQFGESKIGDILLVLSRQI